MSTSFAEGLLDLIESGGDRGPLLRHEALAALLRHQRLSGNGSANAADVLEQALSSVPDVSAARGVLDAWRGREADLYEAACLSARLLPAGRTFDGTIYLVAGYDIGVAAPPDVALNVAHPRFCARPAELAFYATHEAHHVGFLGPGQSMPSIGEAIQSRAGLRGLVRFLTQMEGMAVHAAEPGRRAAGALTDDDDYAVYLDPAAVEHARAEFSRRWSSIAGDSSLEEALVGDVLTAMSSGERLFYRFGALVCRAIEERHGVSAIVSTVTEPGPFWDAATRLMAGRTLAGRSLGAPRVRGAG